MTIWELLLRRKIVYVLFCIQTGCWCLLVGWCGRGEIGCLEKIPGMSESQWLPSYIDDRGALVALVHCIDASYVAALLY